MKYGDDGKQKWRSPMGSSRISSSAASADKKETRGRPVGTVHSPARMAEHRRAGTPNEELNLMGCRYIYGTGSRCGAVVSGNVAYCVKHRD